MILFTCDNTECPNVGIEYNFADGYTHAQCGGCNTILEAQTVKEENNE
jgi:hypothetical protein